MVRFFVGVLALALTPTIVHCESSPEGQACTLIGCGSDGVVIVVGAIAELPAGTWEIEAKSGETSNRCTVVLPTSGGSDCVAGFPADGVLRIHFQGFAPPALDVVVRHDDAPWGGLTGSQPNYTETRPNGPGCAPVCRHAEISVPPPT